MNIHINKNDDIISFYKSFGIEIAHKLEYIYTSSGFRTYINLGKFGNDLFLEIDIFRTKFQFDWFLQKEIFEEVLREFGFKPSGIYFNSEITNFVYPDDISIVKENRLIETLFKLVVGDTRNFMSHKYGLR